MPSFSPHSFRHMLVPIAYQRKLSAAQLKAWSQNLGHESVMTTLTSYGAIPLEMQRQLIEESGPRGPVDEEIDQAMQIIQLLRSNKRS